MYHCFCDVASTMSLGARPEPGKEEVDGLVEDDIAAPEEQGKDQRGDDDDGGRSDDLVPRRPGDLLHFGHRVAEEFTGGGHPLLRFGDDRGFLRWFHLTPLRSSWQLSAHRREFISCGLRAASCVLRLRDLAGQEGLEPPTCGFGDR